MTCLHPKYLLYSGRPSRSGIPMGEHIREDTQAKGRSPGLVGTSYPKSSHCIKQVHSTQRTLNITIDIDLQPMLNV